MKTYIQKLKAALKTFNEPHCNYLVEFDCTIGELLDSQCHTHSQIPFKFHLSKRKCHLIEFVNDGDETLVVYKWWNKSKQRWEYQSDLLWMIESRINHQP